MWSIIRQRFYKNILKRNISNEGKEFIQNNYYYKWNENDHHYQNKNIMLIREP